MNNKIFLSYIIISLFINKNLFADVSSYQKEAKSCLNQINPSAFQTKVKKLDDYTDNPDEVKRKTEDLRIDGDKLAKNPESGNSSTGDAISAVNNSRANEHRTSFTVDKIRNKKFIKRSDYITDNPLPLIDMEIEEDKKADKLKDKEYDCMISDGDLKNEDVKFEEYFEEVKDTRIKLENQQCEEDEDKLFYCTRAIKDVSCTQQTLCPLELAQNRISITSSTGIFGWSYNQSTGEFLVSNKEINPYRHGMFKRPNHYKTSSGSVITVNFFIKDNNLSRLKIYKVFGNMLAGVWINNHLIYEHSRGANSYLPTLIVSGGFSTSFDWKNYNIDLTRYLKNGINTLKVRIYRRTFEEDVFKMSAQKYCCKNWSAEWESDCPK